MLLNRGRGLLPTALPKPLSSATVQRGPQTVRDAPARCGAPTLQQLVDQVHHLLRRDRGRRSRARLLDLDPTLLPHGAAGAAAAQAAGLGCRDTVLALALAHEPRVCSGLSEGSLKTVYKESKRISNTE